MSRQTLQRGSIGSTAPTLALRRSRQRKCRHSLRDQPAGAPRRAQVSKLHRLTDLLDTLLPKRICRASSPLVYGWMRLSRTPRWRTTRRGLLTSARVSAELLRKLAKVVVTSARVSLVDGVAEILCHSDNVLRHVSLEVSCQACKSFSFHPPSTLPPPAHTAPSACILPVPPRP